MAFTRRQWNNIIIIASIVMVAVLSFLQSKTGQMPADTRPLFDDAAPLAQLQLDGLWLQRRATGWQCDPQVLNCEQWANAWQAVSISALEGTPTVGGEPRELLIQIAGIPQSQLWLYFPASGLLKSPAGNWYQIPPSLRETLQPILSAQP
ncbi:hypothetical protein LZP73_08120 [Shewanella sp. AS16]|uniref:hypothetical protein n=1 Tax=Shewanella sp. AS16 TaxID=2907625 RepID=UPI001F2E2A06|nr:hypothetical protein [Shewanella sp. AS16]MCE9686182.1 hypothetical protein [Shewanella sp. AS16]